MTVIEDQVCLLTAEEVDELKREAWDDGRAEAAKVWPLVFDEGFREGFHACRNGLLTILRERAAEPAIRELFMDVLNGRA